MADEVSQVVTPVAVVAVVDSKKPWKSKTMLVAAVLGVLAGLSNLFPWAKPVSDWINSHGMDITVGWSVLAMILRTVTKNAISLED